MITLGYILLSVCIAIILLLGYRHGLNQLDLSQSTRNKRFIFATAGLVAWFAYIFLISNTGILKDFNLPPKFPLLLIFPAFLFTAIVLTKYKTSSIFTSIPTSWTVFYQSFRIAVESLFVAIVGIGILHPEVTYEGYNYDIIFSISALVVGILVYLLKVVPERVVLYWNYLGLVVIAFIIFLFFIVNLITVNK